jgi:mono/diheme cytochrome c family protein
LCHGNDGKGIAGARTPDFADPDWQAGRSDQAMLDAVNKGTDTGMPGFGDQLPSAQIDQLVHCVIRGFARAPQGR